MGNLGEICAYDAPAKVLYQPGVIQIAPEEIAIKKYERNNPLRGNSVEKIINCFKCEGIDCILTFTQTKRAFGALGVHREEMQDPDDPLFEFIVSFESSECYLRENLIVACILLTNSSNNEKLQGLFETFDPYHNKMLEQADLEKMLRVLFRVGTYNALFLAAGNYGDFIPRQKLLDYNNKIKGYEESFIQELKLIILMGQDAIGKDRFLDILNRGRYPQILSPSGLREFCITNFTRSE